MIQPNELRIGNLILRDGKLHTVDVQTIDSVITLEKIDPNLYEPIPLTEDWLKRFGFVRQNGSYFELNGIGLITGYAVDGSFVTGNSFGPRHVHFYNVHQLQNLYWCLTGKELKQI